MNNHKTTRVYLARTNAGNELLYECGGKCFTIKSAPSGIIDGVDLYASCAIEKFRTYFENNRNGLNNFQDCIDAFNPDIYDFNPDDYESITLVAIV